jgi:hypothetical protein
MTDGGRLTTERQRPSANYRAPTTPNNYYRPTPIFTLSALADRIEVKADVAQLVEQPIRNRQVSGSSPLVGSSLSITYLPVSLHLGFGETRRLALEAIRFCRYPGARIGLRSRSRPRTLRASSTPATTRRSLRGRCTTPSPPARCGTARLKTGPRMSQSIG